jgi:exopolysaccharide biosynthesis polyprenyl glycosylphosphotransferase
MRARRELSNFFRPYGDSQTPSSGASAETINPQLPARALEIIDALSAIVSVLCAFLITNLNTMPADVGGFLALRVSVKNLLLTAFFSFAWTSVLRAFGLYEKRTHRQSGLRLIAASACASVFALLFVITSRAGTFKINAVLFTWLIALSLITATRLAFRILQAPAPTSLHPRRALIIGSGPRALRLDGELTGQSNSDYQVLGFVDSANARPRTEISHRMIGDLSELEEILVRNPVDDVLITLPVKSCYAQIQTAIEVCQRIGVECKYLSDIFQPPLTPAGHESLRGFNVISLKPVKHDARFILKRLIDIVGAALGLAVLSPLFLIIALVIKLVDGGPILFNQERFGRNRHRFKMYKFRTMVIRAEELQTFLEQRNEAGGPVFKIRNDPRITRLGMVLRRTSLDELPQLVNVLKGEMSLVGPRPLPGRDVSKFEEAWLMRRFCVAPGLTGLWQVTARSSIRFEDWVRHDFEYIDNWSLKLDFQILAKTIPAVLKGEGAV